MRHIVNINGLIRLSLCLLLCVSDIQAFAPTPVSVLTRPHQPIPASSITTNSISNTPRFPTSPRATTLGAGGPIFGNLELSSLAFDNLSTAFDAWEWTSNMGAPAALVAGAVLVTLSETREALAPRLKDAQRVRWLKLVMRCLLLSSFALEVVSIFVGTMTGSVLLGHGTARTAVGYESPLQLLHHHLEFEYLMTQICFLQGLFHWLVAVAAEFLLPKRTETTSARRMNKSLAAWLISLCFWMLAFYNNHLSFYSDYATMLGRFFFLFFQRFSMFAKPFRPMSLLYVPSFFISMVLTWRAFRSPAEEDEDEHDAVFE